MEREVQIIERRSAAYERQESSQNITIVVSSTCSTKRTTEVHQTVLTKQQESLQHMLVVFCFNDEVVEVNFNDEIHKTVAQLNDEQTTHKHTTNNSSNHIIITTMIIIISMIIISSITSISSSSEWRGAPPPGT